MVIVWPKSGIPARIFAHSSSNGQFAIMRQQCNRQCSKKCLDTDAIWENGCPVEWGCRIPNLRSHNRASGTMLPSFTTANAQARCNRMIPLLQRSDRLVARYFPSQPSYSVKLYLCLVCFIIRYYNKIFNNVNVVIIYYSDQKKKDHPDTF